MEEKNSTVKFVSNLETNWDKFKTKGKKVIKWGFILILFLLFLLFIGCVIGVLISNPYSEYKQELLNNNEPAEGIIFKFLGDIALGIIKAFFIIVLIIVQPISKFLINMCQELIYQCFSFQFVWGNLGISYKTFLILASIVFVILFIIFLAIRTWKIGRGKKEKDSLISTAIAALLMFLFGPILLGILFLASSWIMGLIMDGAYQFNLYDFIETNTLGQINSNNSIYENDGLYFLYIFSVIGCVYFLSRFAVTLILRFFELIVFGLLAIPLVSASSISDEGERFETYQGIMIQKILAPFFLLLGYIIALMLIPAITESIINQEFNTIFVESEWFTLVLIALLPMAAFAILSSLAPEWAFIISTKGKSSFATQINQISGVGSIIWRNFTRPITGKMGIVKLANNANKKRSQKKKKAKTENTKENKEKKGHYNKILNSKGKKREDEEKGYIKEVKE